MQPTTLRSLGAAPLLLTCEHASFALAERYAGLGLDPEQLRDHIGWDIGAAAVTAALSEALAVPAVLSAASRLLVDCNRAECADDLMPERSHGVEIPGNRDIDVEERRRRLRDFYAPFHDAVDARLRSSGARVLLSVHSFTPVLQGRERGFDIGVLFDDFAATAQELGEHLHSEGFAVRMNEPYSGLEGLIYSANRHGRRHAIRYLELEINNGLLGCESGVAQVARAAARAVAALLSAPFELADARRD